MKHALASFAFMNCLALSSPANAQEVDAEIIAELPYSVGNVTFSPDNRIFFSHHPFFSPDVRVAELGADGKSFSPFPNENWNTPREGTDDFLDSVLGLRGDENGVIWMMDMGHRHGLTPKIVGWNTRTDSLERIYYIPEPASLQSSQHNDFVIDPVNRVFVIADEGIGPGGDGTIAALVTVHMDTGATRRVLQGHESTLPEDVPITVNGRDLTVPDGNGGQAVIKVGADGITLDKASEWLYYGPLNGGWIYRLRMSDFMDLSLSEEELGSRVEKYAEKPNNGGLSIDMEGNLYLTEVEVTSVGVIPADTREYRRYASDPNLIWPDGVSYSPDGHMYVSAAQISQAALFNDGEDKSGAPFYIFRFEPLAAGLLSR